MFCDFTMLCLGVDLVLFIGFKTLGFSFKLKIYNFPQFWKIPAIIFLAFHFSHSMLIII